MFAVCTLRVTHLLSKIKFFCFQNCLGLTVSNKKKSYFISSQPFFSKLDIENGHLQKKFNQSISGIFIFGNAHIVGSALGKTRHHLLEEVMKIEEVSILD